MTDIVIEKKKLTATRIKEPTKFKVIVCNDDFTTVEFVVAMLVHVFNHSAEAAVALTLQIHNQGNAVVGVYSCEIAEQKALDGTQMARAHEFPLLIQVVPE
jgi:ATP-dependent Clp protease adaptor protein ClpS